MRGGRGEVNRGAWTGAAGGKGVEGLRDGGTMLPPGEMTHRGDLGGWPRAASTHTSVTPPSTYPQG